VLPFRLHYELKRRFWVGDADDTFPAYYRMNTRSSLQRCLESAGFVEEMYARTDDLSVFAEFKWLGHAELTCWRVLRAIGLPYPERNLLAVYRKPVEDS
jgi:hypothetical protein